MPIRCYGPGDAVSLAEIFNRAVSETASRHYDPEQIAAWLGGGMEAGETHARCSDGRSVWVAADGSDTAVAFIDLEDDGHIDMLFCLPEWSGRGIASALYDHLESDARRRGMTRLRVEASELARPLFQHKGFTLLRRNDFTLDGVAVHNHIMEKLL
ncbi:GNAT family N-acetyltransferase [Aestuariivirga sp.]|uniref:GNAT family N-acetyltransferase n=1 Tax=Aestuariivirga sp. TaxID=2650926 RepID=UPI00359344E3